MEVYIVTQKPVEKNIILDMGTTKSVQDNNLYLTLTQQKKTDQEKTETEKMEYIITLEPLNDALNQIWKIYSTVGNAVIIASANSDLVLTVGPKDEYVDGMQALIAWPGNNAPNQKFVFYPDGSIRPADDETMCLSTKTGNITSQDDKLSNLMLLSKAPDILSDSQKFHFVTPLINKD